MKKAGRISGKISGKTVCCFHYFIVCGGEAGRKSEKDIFFGALKGLEKRVSRKFESYMMGKTGVWHLRKNLVLFGPPDMQKTQEFPGFFGPASFLRDRNARVEQKRFRLSALPFGWISLGRREQYHPEPKTISPVIQRSYHSNGEDYITCPVLL